MAGSGSYSTVIFSSASVAICSVTAATAATPSPAWNTRSSASTGWSCNVAPKELTGISRPVRTAITPGMASAALVSMRTIRAEAMSARLILAWSMPGNARSSM